MKLTANENYEYTVLQYPAESKLNQLLEDDEKLAAFHMNEIEAFGQIGGFWKMQFSDSDISNFDTGNQASLNCVELN